MATSTYAIPQTARVEETIGGLLGRDISCKNGGRVAVMPSTMGMLAQLGDEEGNVFLYVYCDMGLACGLGAALSLISKAEMTQSITDNKPSEGIMENIEEVFNVCRGLFRSQEMHNARLISLDVLPIDLPKEAYKKMMKPMERLDLDIQIEGYGGGKLSMFATG